MARIINGILPWLLSFIGTMFTTPILDVMTMNSKREYLVKFQGFAQDPSDFIDSSDLKVVKKGKYDWFLDGNVVVKQDCPDGMLSSTYIYRLVGPTYIRIAVGSENMDACMGFNEDPFIAPEIRAASNLTDLCPLKEGVYYFKDYTFDTKKLPDNIPEGDYKLELQAYSLEHAPVVRSEIKFSLLYA